MSSRKRKKVEKIGKKRDFSNKKRRVFGKKRGKNDTKNAKIYEIAGQILELHKLEAILLNQLRREVEM